MISRRLFISMLIILVIFGMLLVVTNLDELFVSLIISRLPIITNCFGVLLLILVFGNCILEIPSRASYKPFGDSLSFERLLGPVLGTIVNFGLCGFLSYDCFLTGTTFLSLHYEGKLATFLYTPTIELILLFMVGLIAYASYLAYFLCQSMWSSKLFKKAKVRIP